MHYSFMSQPKDNCLKMFTFLKHLPLGVSAQILNTTIVYWLALTIVNIWIVYIIIRCLKNKTNATSVSFSSRFDIVYLDLD